MLAVINKIHWCVHGGLCGKRTSTLTAINYCTDDRQLLITLVQNCNTCLLHLHSTPPLGEFPSECRHPVWCGKTRMVWLSDGEKISKTCLFVLTWSTNMTDKRTDKHRMTAVAVLMHIIARQKWENETFVADSSVILFHTIISKLVSPRTAHLAPHRLHTFMAQNYFYFFWS